MAGRTPLSSYQKKLFVFLSVATFFEGYDFLALAQLLPELRAEFGLSEGQGGALVALINLGTVFAYVLVRQADRWGRRRVLMVTIAGYTVFTVLTGFAPDAVTFGICQLIARVFLIGEWAVSMVYAAEEFPADRRGMVIGVIQAFSTLGAVACAGLVPVLVSTELGWRTVYFVGAAPLMILAFARRNLRETERFARLDGPARPVHGSRWAAFTHIWRTPHRRRVLQLALIWALTYVCSNNAVTFWKEFAVAERGFDNAQVGRAITISAVAAMPLVFYSGRLLDWLGRRRGGAVIFLSGSVGVALSYTLHDPWALTVALVFGVMGASAVLPVLNSYTTELFPTDVRGDAFAWANNLLGRIGYVLSPLVVGVVAQETSWSLALASTAVFPVIAVVLIFAWLPETAGRELEVTAETQ